jgi:hypothetical protein
VNLRKQSRNSRAKEERSMLVGQFEKHCLEGKIFSAQKDFTHAEFMNPTSQVLSAIPNSSGNERFAPFAPVLSQPLFFLASLLSLSLSRDKKNLLNCRSKRASCNGEVEGIWKMPFVYLIVR